MDSQIVMMFCLSQSYPHLFQQQLYKKLTLVFNLAFIKQQQKRTPLFPIFYVELTKYLMKLSTYSNNYHGHKQPSLGKHASQLVGAAVGDHTINGNTMSNIRQMCMVGVSVFFIQGIEVSVNLASKLSRSWLRKLLYFYSLCFYH